MSQYPVDLHAHTTASDGKLTPTALVKRAAARGLVALAISDHDTIDGIAEAQQAGQPLNMEIVPAIEFSTRHEPEKNFIGIHLLGYFIDPTSPILVDLIQQVKQGRVDQKIKQIEKLQSFGFDITVEEVFAKADGVPGRPHIAATLMEKHPTRFRTVQQVFDEFLGSQAKAHVKRDFALTVAEAIEVVKQVGGLPVLAHPGVYSNIDRVAAVHEAKAAGVEGVEVMYSYEKTYGGPDWVAVINSLADELKLLKTGGTDFHYPAYASSPELGDKGLTVAQFETLKAGWQTLRDLK